MVNYIDDYGISSITILAATQDIKLTDASVPHDPSDFVRCYKMLNALGCADARDRKIVLLEVARKYSEWVAFVDAWEELNSLYEEERKFESAPKLFEAIKKVKGVR